MNSFSVSLLSTLTTRISRTGNDRRIQRRRGHGQGHVVFETSNRGSRLRETEFGSGERRSFVWIVSPINRPSIEPCESRRACVIYRLHTATLRRINDSGSSPTFTHATEAASCYVEFLRKPLRHLFVEINREMKRERLLNLTLPIETFGKVEKAAASSVWFVTSGERSYRFASSLR